MRPVKFWDFVPTDFKIEQSEEDASEEASMESESSEKLSKTDDEPSGMV